MGAALGALVPELASAEDYPSRVIRLIVPYAPGAGTDAVSRLVADQLSAGLGKPVVVENRVGANGNLGTGLVAKAAPDGYTLGTATPGPVAVGRSLYPTLTYDPLTDLAPIVLMNQSPVVMLANPRLPYRSAKDVVDAAKEKPDQLTTAIAAAGSINHLVTELFKLEASAPLRSVPYAGGARAVTDVLGGHVDFVFISLSSVTALVASGELRPLAIAADTRSALLPDVPTMGEIGYPAVIGSQWNGIVAPAATPTPIVDRLNREVRAILELPEIGEQFKLQGMVASGGTPEAFGAFIKAEASRWAAVVARANIQAN